MADINIASNQYVVLNDWIFSPSGQSDAPQWLLNLIDTVVKNLIANNFTDYDLLFSETRKAIDSLNVAQNTFDEYWNLNTLIDGIILSYVQTLNASINGVQGQVVNLQLAMATDEAALAQAVTDLTASYKGYADARATEIITAYADADSVLANSITALTTAFTDQASDLAGTADALFGVQSYVGLTGENYPNGTGMLARLNILEKQTDGIINFYTNNYDAMAGIQDPNSDVSDDQLLTNVEPYASWIAQDINLGTEETRAAHVGDVFIYYTDDENGTRTYVRSYKFIKTAPDVSDASASTDAEGYTWALVTDTDAQAAYVIALNAKDLADGKRRVFVNTPFAPYDIGDLWVDNSGATLNPPKPQVVKVCVTDRTAPLPTDPSLQSFILGNEWILADEQAQHFISTTYEPDSAQIHRQLDGVIEYYFLESYNINNDNFPTLDFTNNVDEAATLAEIAGLYDTAEKNDDANGNIVYFKDSRKAYWYQAFTSSWIAVTDTSIYQALQDAAKAQGAADSKVSQFFAWYTSNDTAPYDIEADDVVGANFKYWYKTNGTLYKRNGAIWDALTQYPDVAEGDILTVYEPTQGDLTTYTYNGISWQQSGPTGIISKSKFFVDLDAAVNGPGGIAEAQADLEITVESYAKNSDGSELSGLSAVAIGWTTDSSVTYAESDAAPIGSCQTLSYTDAVAFAKARGLRLPTLTEVKNGLGQGTGCGYDASFIWTSTRGTTEGTHYRVKGAYSGSLQDIEETADTTLSACRFVADSEDKLNEATLYAQSKLEYNAPVTINGITQNAGFGLVNSASQIPGLTAPTGSSEFWVDANRFVLKNPAIDGVQAVFTVTESGVKLGIEHTEATRNEPKGDYSAGASYVKGDIVSYNGSSYTALQNTTGNLPTNTTYWQLLSAIGYTGIGTDYWFKRSTSVPTNTPNTDGSDANGWYTDLSDSNLNASGDLYIIKGTIPAGGTSWSFGSPKVLSKENIRELTIYSNPTTGSFSVPTTSTYNFTNNTLTINNSNWNRAVPSITSPNQKIYATTAVVVGNETETNVAVSWGTAGIYAQRTDGLTGAYTDFWFIRSTTTPTTNPGNDINWKTDVTTLPAGAGVVWSIKEVTPLGGGASTYSDLRAIEADIIREVVLYSDPTTSTSSPALPTTQFTYNFATDALVGTHSTWNKSFPSGLADGLRVYRTTAIATGNITETAVSLNGKWSAGQVYAERVDGVSFTGTTEYYAKSSDGVNPPAIGTTDPWFTTPPELTSTDKYLWNYNVVNKSNGTSTNSTPTILTTYVADGKGIASIGEQYQLGTSGTTAPTGTWTSSIPAITSSKPYLWNKTTITYTDSTTTVITTLIAARGSDGVSYSGTTEYYRLSSTTLTDADRYSSGTTIATSWTTTPQTPTSTNKYLYNFNRNSRSDSSFTDSAVSLITQYVKDGNGISSITEEYQIGSSDSVAPTETWSSTFTGAGSLTDTNRYMWNKTTINYTEGGSDVKTTVIAVKGTDGSNGINSRAVVLSVGTASFAYNSAGTTPSPNTTTVTATALNTVGTVYYQFLVDGVSNQNSTTNTYTYTPQASFGSMPESIMVRIREGSTTSTILASDTVSMVGLRDATDGTDGIDALTVVISNESHTLPTTNAGVVTYTGSGTTIRVYEGTTELVYGNTQGGNGTWTVSAVGTNVTAGTRTDSGNYVTIGNHSAMTANTALVTYTISGKRADGTAFSLTRVQSLSKSIEGSKGDPGTPGAPGDPGIRGVATLTHTVSINNNAPATVTSADIATYWNAAAPTEFDTEISGDTLILTNTYTDKGWTYIYKFNGTTWSPSVAWQVDGNAVVTGTLSAAAIGTGQLTADYIDSRGLSIKDASGNIILAAGSPLSSSNITPASGWLNSNVSISADGFLTGAGGGSVTIGGLGYTGALDATKGATWGTNVVGQPADYVYKNNLTDATDWVVGQTEPWPTNGTAAENRISWALGPKGSYVPCWECVSAGTNTANGGWTSCPTITIDNTKTYRFAVPVRRPSGGTVTGTAYWGIQTNKVCNLNTTTVNSNPYFITKTRSSMELNRWYLMVGYVFPYGSTGTTHDGAGIYDMETGALVGAGNNFCWANVTTTTHRAYQYYSTNTVDRQLFAAPLVHVIDGSEPSLNELLQGTALLNQNISIGSNGSLSGAGGGAVTIGGLGYTGALDATKGATFGTDISGQITSSNISTYIASAAIGSAYIANAAITTAKIGTAAVDTLQIAGNAVTIGDSVYTAANTTSATAQTLTYTGSGARAIVLASGYYRVASDPYGIVTGGLDLKVDGVTVRSHSTSLVYSSEISPQEAVICYEFNTVADTVYTITLVRTGTVYLSEVSKRFLYIQETRR